MKRRKVYTYYLLNKQGIVVEETNDYIQAISDAQQHGYELRQRLPHIIYKRRRIEKYKILYKPLFTNQLEFQL